jgi:2-(1,2-epoxy-1,2-dihydrophenyl)acetyl-CoA isomerase
MFTLVFGSVSPVDDMTVFAGHYRHFPGFANGAGPNYDESNGGSFGMSENQETDDGILHSIEGGISRITLNRPQASNAIRPDDRDLMIEILNQAYTDPMVRVVVLDANGKHFCSGVDMAVFRPNPGEPVPEKVAGSAMRNFQFGVHRLISTIMDCGKPVICGVQGTAAGLGLNLVLACDMVIASEQAGFIEVFVRRGMVSHAGAPYLLPRLIGLQKAKEMVMFGDRLLPDEALRLGLVNRVVPADQLADTVNEFAGRLANGPTTAIGLAKRLLNRSLDTDRAGSFLEEGLAVEVNGKTHDSIEGAEAFRQGRSPQFRGY